jgi:hypothetical protein
MSDTDGSALVSDLAIGSAAGLGATVVMEYASSWLYEHVESEAARRREEELRDAMPTVVLARKLHGKLGGGLGDEAVDKLGERLHFGFGAVWGPVYALLRRRTRLSPLKLGLLLGTGVSLAFDEGLTPAAGLSPPNRAFPWQTHARAYVAHLVFGAALAAMMELGLRVIPASD